MYIRTSRTEGGQRFVYMTLAYLLARHLIALHQPDTDATIQYTWQALANKDKASNQKARHDVTRHDAKLTFSPLIIRTCRPVIVTRKGPASRKAVPAGAARQCIRRSQEVASRGRPGPHLSHCHTMSLPRQRQTSLSSPVVQVPTTTTVLCLHQREARPRMCGDNWV